jgi:hypothetical protein
MRKVLLFEAFINEATNVKDIAKKILGELDDNAQLFPDYIPTEALTAIEAALKKNKGLIGKDVEKAAKQIRMNLEDIGILSNTFSPLDVEIMIMNHLNESIDESISSSDFDKLVKDLAYSMPNHTKYDDEVGPSEEQIIAAMKKYQKGLYKYTNDAQKKEAVEKVLQILTESKYNGNIAGDAAEYIAKELSQYVKGIIDQPNDNVTYFHLKDKSNKGKVIKTLLDVYGLEAQDGGTQFSPSATIKFDNNQIVESFINEAKELDRDAMMAIMSDKYKIKTVRTTEEFNGETGGIWMAGDNGETLSAGKIFDYYNKSAKYQNGVLKNVVAAAEKAGWWFSWNDPGTIMLWPKK